MRDFYPEETKEVAEAPPPTGETSTQKEVTTQKMSENVQNVHFTPDETLRWEEYTLLKDQGQTDKQIAIHWTLTSTKQVQRLKQKAKQNGAYQQWLEEKRSWIHEEFIELHQKIKEENPELAYSTMAGLLAKSIPSKQEIKADVNADVTEKIEANVTVNTEQLLREYDEITKDTTEETRDLPKNNPKEQVHQTETPT